MNVFCLPPNITFIDGGKLDTALANYSKEEDAELEGKIESYIKEIHRVRIIKTSY